MNRAIKYNSSTHHVFSHAQFFATPCTIAHQDSPSMGFPEQEYWSGLLFPPPGHLLNPGVEPASPAPHALQVDILLFEPLGKPKQYNKNNEKYILPCIKILIHSSFFQNLLNIKNVTQALTL